MGRADFGPYGMTARADATPVRLVCLSTGLPDAVRQGRIPERTAMGTLSAPRVSELAQHLARVHASQVFVAGDVLCTGIFQNSSCSENISGTLLSMHENRHGPDAEHQPARYPDLLRIAALRDRDYGTWHGQALRDLPAEALGNLLHDPDFTPPDGESARQFHTRVGAWLKADVPHDPSSHGAARSPTSGQTGAQTPPQTAQKTVPQTARHPPPQTAEQTPPQTPDQPAPQHAISLFGTVLMVVRPAVVRALAAHILGGGPDMDARLDIAPETFSIFTRQADRWRVRMLGSPEHDLPSGGQQDAKRSGS